MDKLLAEDVRALKRRAAYVDADELLLLIKMMIETAPGTVKAYRLLFIALISQDEYTLPPIDSDTINFACGKCGEPCLVAPDPPDAAICTMCCGKSEDGHDFKYDPDEQAYHCVRCDEPCPEDWYHQEDDVI